MYAFNVTIQGSTRRIFASNMRVAVATAMRGGIRVAGDHCPFEKMTDLTIGAVRESSKAYRTVKFAGVRQLPMSELAGYDWRSVLRLPSEGPTSEAGRFVRCGQASSLILAKGDEHGLNAGMGLAAVKAPAEATHLAAFNGSGTIEKLIELTPKLRAEAVAIAGSR